MRLSSFVILLAMTAACFGCAFRSGEQEDPRSWPPPAAPDGRKLRAAFTLSPGAVPPTSSQQWSKWIWQTYMDSALFSEFRFGIEDPDLNVEVEVTQEISGSIALLWTSYGTLFLLPCYATEDFACKTTFKDSSGKVLGVIEKKGCWTLVLEILFLPALPFETPVSVKRQMMVDLNRSTILDALERGYLGR